MIVYSSHNVITKDTSCYNKSISRLELGCILSISQILNQTSKRACLGKYFAIYIHIFCAICIYKQMLHIKHARLGSKNLSKIGVSLSCFSTYLYIYICIYIYIYIAYLLKVDHRSDESINVYIIYIHTYVHTKLDKLQR